MKRVKLIRTVNKPNVRIERRLFKELRKKVGDPSHIQKFKIFKGIAKGNPLALRLNANIFWS